jgi:hypothetical protein
MGDGISGNINPFQVLIGFESETDESNSVIVKDKLSAHLQFLEEFLKIATGGLQREEANLLLIYIRKLYKNFNLNETTNFTKLKTDEFPRFQDLHELLETELNLPDKTQLETERIKGLLILLSRFVDGGSDAIL